MNSKSLPSDITQPVKVYRKIEDLIEAEIIPAIRDLHVDPDDYLIRDIAVDHSELVDCSALHGYFMIWNKADIPHLLHEYSAKKMYRELKVGDVIKSKYPESRKVVAVSNVFQNGPDECVVIVSRDNILSEYTTTQTLNAEHKVTVL